MYGVPEWGRTTNLPLRRGMLYPIELLGHFHGDGGRATTAGAHVSEHSHICHAALARN